MVETKKNTVPAIVISLISLFMSVCGIVYSLVYARYTNHLIGYFFPLLGVLVFSVFLLASLTTNRGKMLKVVGLIINIISLVANTVICLSTYFIFIIGEVKTPIQAISEPLYFGFSLLIVISSILTFIYFLSSFRNGAHKLYKPMAIVTSSLIFAFSISVLVFSIITCAQTKAVLSLEEFFMLLSYGFIYLIPMLGLNFVKDIPEETAEEVPAEEEVVEVEPINE